MRLQALWEARWILTFLALLAIVFGLFSAWAFWFFVLLCLCTVAFFRDPERAAPARSKHDRRRCGWHSDGHRRAG